MLAALSGNQLHILPMNSATDTAELLGGFEQVFHRSMPSIINQSVFIMLSDAEM